MWGEKLNPKLGVVTKYRAQKITGKKQCKINKMDRPLARLTDKERRHRLLKQKRKWK